MDDKAIIAIVAVLMLVAVTWALLTDPVAFITGGVVALLVVLAGADA